jgi:hypothetical protein
MVDLQGLRFGPVLRTIARSNRVVKFKRSSQKENYDW